MLHGNRCIFLFTQAKESANDFASVYLPNVQECGQRSASSGPGLVFIALTQEVLSGGASMTAAV